MRTAHRTVLAIAFNLLLVCGCLHAQDSRSFDMAAPAFKAEVAKGTALLLDVRTPSEYAGGHIAGSTNIDWTAADYEARFAKLDPKTPVLVYCHSGGRSEQAQEYLVEKGFTVTNLTGGFADWKKAGYPVAK